MRQASSWACARTRGCSAAIAVCALLATAILGAVAAATEPALRLAWGPAIELTLAVSGFGRVMVVVVVGRGADRRLRSRNGAGGPDALLVLLLAFVSAMLLLVVAGDFVTLLLGWELVGATSWALIGHGWRDRANTEAGTQAFVTTRLATSGSTWPQGRRWRRRAASPSTGWAPPPPRGAR